MVVRLGERRIGDVHEREALAQREEPVAVLRERVVRIPDEAERRYELEQRLDLAWLGE